MRPTNIDEVVGQQHLIGYDDKGHGRIIRRMVDADLLSSMILYGPPGTGKTSLAVALSKTLGITFRYFNASNDDKKKLQAYATESNMMGQIIVFIDEIHRMDKAKQDYLLQYMENGDFIVIGATTDNPYLTIRPAIRSRVNIFELKPVSNEDILTVLKRALVSKQGLLDYQVDVADNDLLWLASATNGDVRSALNALELATLSQGKNADGKTVLDRGALEECVQRKALPGDKNGDSHYDTISALQKSIRGSDADAGLHYLARLLEGGDLEIACRRLSIIAFEDIGIANPQAGVYTMACIQSALSTGLPEARIPLADAVVYLALSPKSNTAYKGINSAVEDLESGKGINIPPHLKDAHYKGASALGRGVTYKYPHDYVHDWVPQQYLPDDYVGVSYLDFDGDGNIEKSLGQRYSKLKENQSTITDWNKK